MSTPFAGNPGAQRTFEAIRGGGPAETIDPAAHDRIDALEGRVSRLEGAQHQDAAEAGQEGGSDGQ